MGFLLLEPSCCTLLQKYDANVLCCWGHDGDVCINTAGLPFHREWLFPVRGDMCTTIATFWRISWSTNLWPCSFTRWCLRQCPCSVEGLAVSVLFLLFFFFSFFLAVLFIRCIVICCGLFDLKCSGETYWCLHLVLLASRMCLLWQVWTFPTFVIFLLKLHVTGKV